MKLVIYPEQYARNTKAVPVYTSAWIHISTKTITKTYIWSKSVPTHPIHFHYYQK